ncbi:ClpP/crotonase [Neolentinus lepideus HHB14362 ss-1]|uniref:3-hydroxyisobutyryl-CoA hydrolase n=1 Tax=Neolentinus lepideus HHB14362 ss-1 TaxID=1314782 RepID=A0A165TY16_9AGAM|nr:ClpP/crotonase [Neolentinus lepideus HHB14362 ss-1]
MSTDSEDVLFQSHLSSRTYILNRPNKLNALDESMLNTLRPKIVEFAAADLCKLIIGRGNGRAFCAGGDVASVVRQAAHPSTRPRAVDFFKREFEMDYLLASLGKPYVAIMDGITMGGGAGLCMQAPFRIATENTKFAMPETKIGYSPDVGASAFLARLDGALGPYLALTSETIVGREVYELGLATHFVPSASVPALLRALEALEEPSWETVDAVVEAWYEGAGDTGEAKLSAFAQTGHGHPQTQTPAHTGRLARPSGPHTGAVRAALDAAFSYRSVADILDALLLLSHRSSLPDAALDVGFRNFTREEVVEAEAWARRTREALGARSPTSLVVALEAQRRGREALERGGNVLREALGMELGVATAFVNGASPDFATGVRAVLIDKLPKDQRPAWEPSDIEAINEDEIIKKFFDESSPFFDPKPQLDIPKEFAERPISDPNRYALPSEKEIESVIRGSHRTSGDFGMTVEELVDKCERDLAPGSRKSRRTKGGIREKVVDVVRRKCEVEEEGKWVKWRG